MFYQFDATNLLLGVFGTTAFLGVVGYLGRSLIVGRLAKYVDRRVDHQFNERLEQQKGEITKEVETHKGQLNRVAEQLKAEYQRSYYRYSLYEQKRHEAYAELQRRVLITAVAFLEKRAAGRSQAAFASDPIGVAQTMLRLDGDEHAVRAAQELVALYDEGARPAVAAQFVARHFDQKYTAQVIGLETFYGSHLLYLTDAVAARYQTVGRVFAELSKSTDAHDPAQIQAAIDALRDVMRDELSGQ